MKLYAIKCNSECVGVRRNPSLKDASTDMYYTQGEYFVASQEQVDLLKREDIEIICEVKKSREKSKKAKAKEVDKDVRNV